MRDVIRPSINPHVHPQPKNAGDWKPDRHRGVSRAARPSRGLARTRVHPRPAFKVILPDITEPVARAEHLADLFRAMLALERRTGQPVFGVVHSGRVVAAATTEGTGQPGLLGMITTGLGQTQRLVRGGSDVEEQSAR
jgi:hypothetical protein